MDKIEREVMELYNDWDIPLRQIRKELGLSYKEFHKIYIKLKKGGYVSPRPFKSRKKPPKPIKNYSWSNVSKHFQIRKNGIYYGCCKSEEQAIEMVRLFEENNWDVSLKDEIKKQVVGDNG